MSDSTKTPAPAVSSKVTTTPLKKTADAVAKATQDVNTVAANPEVAAAAEIASPYIPKKVRNVFYILGVILGALGTAGSTIAAVLDQNSALIVGSIAAFLLAANSLIAKLHLS